MAAKPSDGLGGRPGDRWWNLTDDTWYQLVASLRKSCTVCVRRHGRISPRPWPIPFHLHWSVAGGGWRVAGKDPAGRPTGPLPPPATRHPPRG